MRQFVEEPLTREYFARSVHEVARDLIGCTLLYGDSGGIIVETESYHEEDPACHAYVGRTKRTEVLFGPPGHAYVYRSYGIHALLNFVCEPEGQAAAVLVRALEPRHGLAGMRIRRADRSDLELCSGPGKLTRALGIDLVDNTKRLDREPFRLLAPDRDWQAVDVVSGPRIGISKAVDYPWRFSVAGSPYVSRPRPV